MLSIENDEIESRLAGYFRRGWVATEDKGAITCFLGEEAALKLELHRFSLFACGVSLRLRWR